MTKSLHVKKGDTVIVIAGSEKGNKGKVLKALPDSNRVLVERLNLIKRHQKPSQKNPTGGIVEKEAAIHASNVKLVCPECSKPTVAKRHVLEDGKVMRRCAECGETFE